MLYVLNHDAYLLDRKFQFEPESAKGHCKNVGSKGIMLKVLGLAEQSREAYDGNGWR
jgi:hypothetical protein